MPPPHATSADQGSSEAAAPYLVLHGDPRSAGILRRALKNAGLLLGGKSAGGLMQLVMLAILARALGLSEFGIFSVVIAQILLLSGLIALDSNQAIVRYGVLHLATYDRRALQALFKTGALLDIVAALVATISIVALAPLIGTWIGWSDEAIFLTQLCAPIAFANVGTTAMGMLRLLNRFDLLTVHATLTPAGRLILVALLALFDAPIAAYGLAWIATSWIGAAAALIFAWREAARLGLLVDLDLSIPRSFELNPGFLRFAVLSQMNASVALVPKHLSVIVVAAMLGVQTAGIFKIAREVGDAITKPLMLFNQALYPEVARMVAAASWVALKQAAMRSSGGAAALGLGVALIMLPLGPLLIRLVFGVEYVSAAPLLVMVALAASIRALALAADPILYALGHAHLPLLASGASALLFLGVMVWQLPLNGLVGAGWAFLAMSLLGAAVSGLWALRDIEHRRVADTVCDSSHLSQEAKA